MPPWQADEMRSDPANPPELFQVGAMGPGVDACIRAACGYGVWRPAHLSSVLRQFTLLHEEAAIVEGEQLRVLRTQFEALVQLLARRCDGGRRRDAARARYERCRDHALAHLERITTVRALCDETGISRTHLDRLFRRFAGREPQAWLRAARATRVCACLAGSDRTLESIAEELHYSSAFALSRSFKAVFGMPPSVWRVEVGA